MLYFIQKEILYKARLMLKYIRKRKADAARASKFDIIFIFRDALPTGSIKYERLFQSSGAKLIYDFDDAIFVLNMSEGNKSLSFLKRPEKPVKSLNYAIWLLQEINTWRIMPLPIATM